MENAPDIHRTEPEGPIAAASPVIPVIATLRWVTTEVTEVDAFAIAWTRDAVQVEWRWKGRLRADWLPAADVRRPGRPRPVSPGSEPAHSPERRRAHW